MNKKLFTLVELLVVIGIIVLLAGMLLPAINSARAKASAADCLNNIRQINSAALSYSIEWKQQLPKNWAISGGNEYNVVGGWYQTGWNGPHSWAGVLYLYTLNDKDVYLCKNAQDAPSSGDGMVQRWDMTSPALSYSIVYEIAKRKTINLSKPSQAIYLFDNDYTSSYAIQEYIAKGTGEDKETLNNSLSHTNPKGNAIQNNVDGKSFREAFDIFAEVHNGKLNIAFVDGHAGTFAPKDLINKNVVTDGASKLSEDYYRK